MRLHDLARVVTGGKLLFSGDVPITGLAHDSRVIRPGDAFFCYPGAVTDGHRYIPAALDAGAAALVVENADQIPPGTPAIVVPDGRLALAEAADSFYGHPSGRLLTVGVTGTKGKTTTTYLVRAVLEAAGLPTGLLGTVNYIVAGRPEPIQRTTPESLDLQELLRRMVDNGDRAAVMEVSSHALALKRVHGVDFDLAVFTNLGHDHLDFHHTMDEYRETKGLLFRALSSGAKAIINMDDPAGAYYIECCTVPVTTYGLGPNADVRAAEISVRPGGASYLALTPAGEIWVNLKLTGLFNVYNSLAAFAAGIALGASLSDIKHGLEAVSGVPGRFETVDAGQEYAILVDYAHTAESLKNALQTARSFTQGRLIVAFGCGGDRDRMKRPAMGRVAGQLADVVILTSDNPRTEDPEAIIQDMVPGVLEAGRSPEEYLVEPDRRRAIEKAVALARPGDVLLLAGKGHETYQDFGKYRIHFDDREVAREAVARTLGSRQEVRRG